MSDVVRAAVVGAGSMGRHHVRILGAMPGVELVAVVDPSPQAAGLLNIDATRRVATLDELPDVDFAVVATPTDAHADTAIRLIERGVSVLVEKPLAGDPATAARIVKAAEDAGVLLAVGHVERFSPTVTMLARIAQDPRFVQFERLSPFTPRIRDSVVFDLMVHDLDLACWICGGRPKRILASGCSVFSDSIDIAAALLEFPDGRIASVQASRATQDKVRRISLSEPDRYIVADCIRQDLSMRRQTTVEFGDEEPLYRQASIVEIPYIDRSGEPLVLELRDVIDAVRNGRPPTVSGQDGLLAVELAAQVEDSILRGGGEFTL